MPDYTLRSEDVYHKSQLHRLLIEIVDHPVLAHALAFKGGTCAAMLGYLDRFSVDLDFDALPGFNEKKLHSSFLEVFNKLELTMLLAFDNPFFFQLRYENEPGKRCKLKLSAHTMEIRANKYQVQYFPEVNRYINCQTIETMFANKLVAILDRYKQHQSIAGRDIYDIHHFFIKGYHYQDNVIQERTNLTIPEFLKDLIVFIRKNINETIINEDLNSLLPKAKFQKIRKVLIPETISLLERELDKRITQ